MINACEVDQQFPREAQAQAEEIFGKSKLQADGKFKQMYMLITAFSKVPSDPSLIYSYWEGCTHGFAVRGDLVSLILHPFDNSLY